MYLNGTSEGNVSWVGCWHDGKGPGQAGGEAYWGGDRESGRTANWGRTVTAVDVLLVEGLLEVDGEGLRAAMAATVPCLAFGKRRFGFRGHSEILGRARSGLAG